VLPPEKFDEGKGRSPSSSSGEFERFDFRWAAWAQQGLSTIREQTPPLDEWRNVITMDSLSALMAMESATVTVSGVLAVESPVLSDSWRVVEGALERGESQCVIHSEDNGCVTMRCQRVGEPNKVKQQVIEMLRALVVQRRSKPGQKLFDSVSVAFVFQFSSIFDATVKASMTV
jgi:hypothetical protein